MKFIFLPSLTILISIFWVNQVIANDALLGVWHINSMFCSSQPQLREKLKPLPISDFSPDMYITFSKAKDFAIAFQKKKPG